MKASRGDGLIDIPSNHPVDETVEKLKGILQAKGVTLFALVDHSGEAAKVGMKMRPTKLLIFGNPKGGTPVMLAAPTIAIDLPLKILIWEDAQGKVLVTYNSPPLFAEATPRAGRVAAKHRSRRSISEGRCGINNTDDENISERVIGFALDFTPFFRSAPRIAVATALR